MTGMEIDLLHATIEGGVRRALDSREGVACRCSNCEHNCDALTGGRTGKCGLRNPVIGEDGRCMFQVRQGGKRLVSRLANVLARVRTARLVDGVLSPEIESSVRKLLAEADGFCGYGEECDDDRSEQA